VLPTDLELGDSAPVHPSDGPDIDVRIRIDEGGVRFAVTVNLAFVDANTDFVRELEDHLDEAEFGPLFEELTDYFARAVAVEIDGRPVELLTRTGGWGELTGELTYVEGNQAMVRHFPVSGIRALSTVRIEFGYPSATEPHQVAILWREFPPDLAQPVDPPPPMRIRTQLNDGSGDVALEFTAEEPQHVWHGEVTTALERFLPVVEPPAPAVVALPLASLGLGAAALLLLALATRGAVRARPARLRAHVAGAFGLALLAFALRGVLELEVERGAPPALAESDAVAIFEALHANLYTAFDYDDRDEIYGALANCVAGEQLDALYQRVFRSLVMADQGGAVSRVQAVRHLATSLESSGVLPDFGTEGFTVATRWQVDGRVSHFGHTHERTQEYAGRFTIGEVDGAWRILGDELLEEFVVDARAADR
jgi:hypothetical protein